MNGCPNCLSTKIFRKQRIKKESNLFDNIGSSMCL